MISGFSRHNVRAIGAKLVKKLIFRMLLSLYNGLSKNLNLHIERMNTKLSTENKLFAKA